MTEEKLRKEEEEEVAGEREEDAAMEEDAAAEAAAGTSSEEEEEEEGSGDAPARFQKKMKGKLPSLHGLSAKARQRVVHRKIRKEQKRSWLLAIPAVSFQRFAKYVVSDLNDGTFGARLAAGTLPKFQGVAMAALQHSAEHYLINVLTQMRSVAAARSRKSEAHESTIGKHDLAILYALNLIHAKPACLE